MPVHARPCSRPEGPGGSGLRPGGYWGARQAQALYSCRQKAAGAAVQCHAACICFLHPLPASNPISGSSPVRDAAARHTGCRGTKRGCAGAQSWASQNVLPSVNSSYKQEGLRGSTSAAVRCSACCSSASSFCTCAPQPSQQMRYPNRLWPVPSARVSWACQDPACIPGRA